MTYCRLYASHIRTRKLQCHSCSLVYTISPTPVEVCLSCTAYWEKKPRARLREPPALSSARTQHISSGSTSLVAGYQGSSLAAEADTLRQGASNMRLNSAKPTTLTTGKRFTAMNAESYKATKNQISHFQKTHAAAGGNVIGP